MIFKLTVLFLNLLVYNCCLAQTANRFDVLITELMPDPSPVVSLPNAEYIELKNVSSNVFNLNGWKISNGITTATITSISLLQPDSIVIICSSTNAPLFLSYGRTVGVSNFPSLGNDGDLISLVSPQGKNIHAIEYNADWYSNAVKSDGGWSLEIMDTKNPCSGRSNWKASTHVKGGTPGKLNSIAGINSDDVPPKLKRSFATDSVTVLLMFDEPLDSGSAAIVNNYSISNNISIVSAKPLTPLFNVVQLKLTVALQTKTVYTITATAIIDCKGNTIGAFNKAKSGLGEDATAGDLIVNEILFNPKTGGFDYVEIYNNSNKTMDAAKVFIANRNSTGIISSPKKLSLIPYNISPGDYVVVTEDMVSLNQNYFVKNADAVFILNSLPSYPDNEGTVVITNAQGAVVDEIHYKDDWQFGLIANADGVAIERIDFNGVSQNKNNWHSAASTAGYGTPGYVNSQYKISGTSTATIEVTPKIFSPDNDGTDDVATIQYNISESGYVANVTIFDAGGRQVRYLVKNNLLGLKGSWTWDGLGKKGEQLPIGTYIIYTEIFNLKGKKERFKSTIVLARRLN